MNWQIVISFVVGAVIYLAIKKLSHVGPQKVRECLKAGAKVIDVRSEEEFKQERVPGAVNIPLGRLQQEISRYAPDKEQPVLLHCLSGGRSAIGRAMLRRMGYRHCFNLGSLGRAQKLAGGRDGTSNAQ